MAIQSLTGNTNNSILASKPKPSDKAEASNLTSAQQPNDSVAITSAAKKINEVFELSDNKPPINEELVAAIKQSLEEGTYSINADKIAEKMIEIEQ